LYAKSHFSIKLESMGKAESETETCVQIALSERKASFGTECLVWRQHYPVYFQDNPGSSLDSIQGQPTIKLLEELVAIRNATDEILNGEVCFSDPVLVSRTELEQIKGSIRNIFDLLLSDKIDQHLQGRSAMSNLFEKMAMLKQKAKVIGKREETSEQEKAHLQTCSDSLSQILEEHSALARENLKSVLPADVIANLVDLKVLILSRWRDNIKNLMRRQSINSSHVFNLLANANGSDDPNDWLLAGEEDPYQAIKYSRLGFKDSSCLSLQSRLIEAARVVEKSPQMRAVEHHLRKQEESLRDQATVLGRRPENELIVIPHANWIFNSDTNPEFDDDSMSMKTKEWGSHCENSAQKANQGFSMVYIAPQIEFKRSTVKESSISTARHELIHESQLPTAQFNDENFVSQAKDFLDTEDLDPTELNPSRIKEGITEALNAIRSPEHKKLAATMSSNDVPVDAVSYLPEVKAWFKILDRLEISAEDKAFLLENFNTMNASQIKQIVENGLQKSSVDRAPEGKDFFTAWLKAINNY
jgi:hypothetical protein